MLKEFAEKNTVYIVTGYTDMRKSIDGLAVIIKAKYDLDPYSKASYCHSTEYRDDLCVHRENPAQGVLQEYPLYN